MSASDEKLDELILTLRELTRAIIDHQMALSGQSSALFGMQENGLRMIFQAVSNSASYSEFKARIAVLENISLNAEEES